MNSMDNNSNTNFETTTKSMYTSKKLYTTPNNSNSDNSDTLNTIKNNRQFSNFLSQLEENIYILINYIRTNPKEYAQNLLNNNSTKLTDAKLKTINYLESINDHELLPYTEIPEITLAARLLINNIALHDNMGEKIDLTQIDPNYLQLRTRLSKYGQRSGRIFETIIFKVNTDEEIVEHILNDEKGKNMLLNFKMKYIGIACDYLPSQKLCTVIDIVQDFIPFKRMKQENLANDNEISENNNNVINNKNIINNNNQNNINMNIRFTNLTQNPTILVNKVYNKKTEYCKTPKKISLVNNSPYFYSRIPDSASKPKYSTNVVDEIKVEEKYNNINGTEVKTEKDRFTVAGQIYKKQKKEENKPSSLSELNYYKSNKNKIPNRKYETKKMCYKEKMEILHKINKQRFNTPKPFFNKEKSIFQKKALLDKNQNNNSNNYYKNINDDSQNGYLKDYKNRKFNANSYKNNKDYIYINKNNLSQTHYNYGRKPITVFDKNSRKKIVDEKDIKFREMLKNEIKSELRNELTKEVKEELKNEFLNEIYTNQSSIYETNTNRKQNRQNNFFGNNFNNNFRTSSEIYNNNIKSLNRSKNKCFSASKYHIDNSNNINNNFNRLKNYYYENFYQNNDDGRSYDGKEETYEKLKSECSIDPVSSYIDKNSYSLMSGQIKSRSKNKQEIKKLIKIYNMIKANRRKNKIINNINQHNKQNSISSYYDYQTAENFYPQINQQNIYFESNISKNDRSLNSIDFENNEIENSTDEDFAKSCTYITKYEKVKPKSQIFKSKKTKNDSEKNINIEITQNFGPGGSININNCGNNNINNSDCLSKKFSDFSNTYIPENTVEKNINILAKKTGRFGKMEDRENLYKKINYKPTVEKNLSNDNEITTITTKKTNINSFDHPPYTITNKVNTQKETLFEDHYKEENNNNLVYSKKKFDCFSVGGERNANYNNFLNRTESTLHDKKKDMSIISIESEMKNIVSSAYNQSFNFFNAGNINNDGDEYSCYVNQTLSFSNNKRGGVFPFYLGHNHKKSRSNDFSFGQIKLANKENNKLNKDDDKLDKIKITRNKFVEIVTK